MARRIWIVAKKDKIEESDIDEARINNCPEIANGIPLALQAIVTEDLLPCPYEEPPEPAPALPLSTHWARIDSFHPGELKPMRVSRAWNGGEYLIDCYVTEAIKDQYLAGNIGVGDFVLVQFLDADVDRPAVFAKIFKTW